MISAFDAILGTILVVILGDVLFSGIIMIHIHFSAKRSWKKNNKSYPYFSYPFLKKIFFLGLKGALNPAIVIFTFLMYLSAILMIIACIWIIISPSLWISYLYRCVIGINGACLLLRSLIYCIVPVSFSK